MPIRPDAVNDTPVIETARLLLTFGEPDDADDVFPLVHGEAGRPVTDNLVWDGPESAGELRAHFAKHGTGTFEEAGFHWMIRDKEGAITGRPGRTIGGIGVRPTDAEDMCDIGYWLGEPFWRQGIMTEAVRAVTERCFAHWGYRRVAAAVFPHNEGSIGLLEGLGFRRTAVTHEYTIKRGCPVDSIQFEITADQLIR